MRNLRKSFKWRHLRAKGKKKGLEVQDWCSFSTLCLCVSTFLLLECPAPSGIVTFSQLTLPARSPPSTQSLPNKANQYLLLPFLAISGGFCAMPICHGLHWTEHFYYCSQGCPSCFTCILCSSQGVVCGRHPAHALFSPCQRGAFSDSHIKCTRGGPDWPLSTTLGFSISLQWVVYPLRAGVCQIYFCTPRRAWP